MGKWSEVDIRGEFKKVNTHLVHIRTRTLAELSLRSNSQDNGSMIFSIRQSEDLLVSSLVWIVSSPCRVMSREGERSDDEGDEHPAPDIVGWAAGS